MKLYQFKTKCLKIRLSILKMISVNNRGHFGSAMSLVEILVFYTMNF